MWAVEETSTEETSVAKSSKNDEVLSHAIFNAITFYAQMK